MTAAPAGRRRGRAVIVFLISLAVPVGLYYLLRGLGVGVYAALLVTGVLSAAPSVYQLVRGKVVGRIALYFSFMSVGALLISAVPGDERFLLAKGAVLTAATAVVFALSLRARRPVVFSLSRPLLEGRWNWPAGWDGLYEESSRFRRMWRVSTVLWSLGLLADAAGRVLMAFTLPPDVVPALATVLYVATLVVLNVGVNAYYITCGVFRRGSRLYERDLATG
ncbi:VC0807 family protein [Arthrobacter sp. JSM 101049]|uniref:VC0807 family protein n=1 Tax=Arthrobacter sp. JSM 101049 TaxID=929097 RepID=UPI0035691A58